MVKIRVILSVPSLMDCNALGKALAMHTGLEVVGKSLNPSQALHLLREQKPDVVLIEKSLTEDWQFQQLKSVCADLGIRYLILRGWRDGTESQKSDVPFANSVAPLVNVEGLFRRIVVALEQPEVEMGAVKAGPGSGQHTKLVLIGASTGGVDALIKVLSKLPRDCPPIAIVQHTGSGYGESLVSLLDRSCPAHVIAAKTGQTLTPGMVALAASATEHLQITNRGGTNIMRLRSGAPVTGHRPSVDVLFQSAVKFAAGVVGVLLTGMGKDGARGLLDLRQAGAHTIVQNEKSCVVYGMPRVAWEMGAGVEKLDIHAIGDAILRKTRVDA